MNIKITVVMVTYGERAHFIHKSCLKLDRELVDNIIIVTNGVDDETLLTIKSIDDSRITIISLQENLGSAYGYKVGLEKACSISKGFILFLDDDNIVVGDGLNKFIKSWHALGCKEDYDALLGNRLLRSRRYISEINSSRTTVSPNSFCAFHYKNIIYYIVEQFFPKVYSNKKEYGIVKSAYYGGLFFHKKLIKGIGYPNENYFVYCDDIEFSYRIAQHGGSIYFLTTVLLDDLEESRNTGGHYLKSLVCGEEKRVYLSVRNNTYFEKSIINNVFIYFINKFFFYILLYGSFLIYGFKNKFIILKAMADGKNNTLGIPIF